MLIPYQNVIYIDFFNWPVRSGLKNYAKRLRLLPDWLRSAVIVPTSLPCLVQCPTVAAVPGQRAQNKKVISVPMEKDLLDAVEKYAASKGWNRIYAIKFMCRKVLGLKLPRD